MTTSDDNGENVEHSESWRRTYDDKLAREQQTYEQHLVPHSEVTLGRYFHDRGAWYFEAHVPDAFLRDMPVTEDEAEVLRAAMDRTFKREFKKVCAKRFDRRARAHADAVEARLSVVPRPGTSSEPDICGPCAAGEHAACLGGCACVTERIVVP